MEIIKKLYTTYMVKKDFDDAKNDPNAKMISYSDGEAEFIKYHETLDGFIKAALNVIIKGNGRFGLELTTDDDLLIYYKNRYGIVGYICTNHDKDYTNLFKTVIDIIDAYKNVGNIYWEIPTNSVIMYKELTGHSYYRSAYELADSCGTCDGGKCESCKEIYTVEDIENNTILYEGPNKETATKIYKDKLGYDNIIDSILDHYNIDHKWFDSYIEENKKYDSVFEPLKLLIEYTNCPVVYR